MASCDDETWYLAASGVPVGWNEGAVGFRALPLPALVSFWIVPGAIAGGWGGSGQVGLCD